MKKIYALIGLLVIIFILMLFAESQKEKPIDWTETYGLDDKIPFGMYVFNEEHYEIFKKQNISKFGKTPYEFLNTDNPYKYNYDTEYQEDYEYTTTTSEDYTSTEDSVQAVYDSAYAEPDNYEESQYNQDSLVVAPPIVDDEDYEEGTNDYNYEYPKKGLVFSVGNTIDKTSMDELLKYVKQGNEAFISSEYFNKSFLDSLGLKVNMTKLPKERSKSGLINSKEVFIFDKQYASVFFSKINSKTTKVLGYYNLKNKLANYIAVQHGSGKFYLHLNPISFTNYNLLNKKNHRYTEKVLSFLNNDNIYWYAKGNPSDEESGGLLNFIMKNPSLKWAYWLLLIGVALYILFNSKRRQRIIPIIEPVKNTTVDFTKTIGNLYYMEGNHYNIIQKMVTYFLEKVRSEYHLDTSILDESFTKKLAQKSNNDLEPVQKLIRKINGTRNNPLVTEADVVELNKLLEKLNF